MRTGRKRYGEGILQIEAVPQYRRTQEGKKEIGGQGTITRTVKRGNERIS